MKPAASDRRVPFLDALRGFAALWVVLFHCAEGRHLPALTAAMPAWLARGVFEAGHLGVPIFFVLSGFVLARISIGKLATLAAASRFVAQRLIRLSPPYYVAVGLGLAVSMSKRGLEGGAAPSAGQVLVHLAYAQDILHVPPLSAVFWTLAFEVQFYVAFALLLWAASASLASSAAGPDGAGLRAARQWLLVAVAAACALLWPIRPQTTTLWNGGFLGFWYSFLCGALVGLARPGQGRRALVALAHVAVVAAIALAAGDAFAGATAATALLILAAERWPALGMLLGRTPLTALGLVSYSLYLFHNPVTGVTARVVRRFVGSSVAGDALLLAIVLAACIGFAVAAYLLVERPAIRWSHAFARWHGGSTGDAAAIAGR